jgi:hypothetical protein
MSPADPGVSFRGEVFLFDFFVVESLVQLSPGVVAAMFGGFAVVCTKGEEPLGPVSA